MTENIEIVLRSGKTLNYATIADPSPSTSNMEPEGQSIGNSSPQVVSQNELEEKVDGQLKIVVEYPNKARAGKRRT